MSVTALVRLGAVILLFATCIKSSDSPVDSNGATGGTPQSGVPGGTGGGLSVGGTGGASSGSGSGSSGSGGSGGSSDTSAHTGAGGRPTGTGGGSGGAGSGGSNGSGSGGAIGPTAGSGGMDSGAALGSGGILAPADAGATDAATGSAADASRADGGTTSGKRPGCPAGPYPAPVAGASKPVCADFAFNYNYNEGPTWIASQNAFFFSNYVMHAGTQGDIVKYTPGGSCEIFLHDVGCNGLAAAPDGTLVGACHQSRSIVRFDVNTRQATTVADHYMGQMFDSPNDLVVHSNGTIYFSNPNAELGGRPPGFGLAAFRVDPSGNVTLFAQGFTDGIGLSPDEKKLYLLSVADWDLDAQGVPSNRASFFASGDGMAVDCAGNIYASGTIFSATGQRLGAYSSGTNLAFGGADAKTLLVVGPGITAHTVPMNLPGLP